MSIYKKNVSVITLLIYIFSLFLTYIPVYAIEDESPNILIDGISVKDYNNKVLANTYSKNAYLEDIFAPAITINDQNVYSLQYNKQFLFQEKYSEVDYDDDLVKNILYYGYPNDQNNLINKYNLTKDEAMYWTQVAIWNEKSDISIDVKNVPYYDELISLAKNNPITENKLTLNKECFTFMKYNDYLETEEIIVSGNTNSITIASTEEIWSVDINGLKKNTFNVGESFKIRANKNYEGDGLISVSAEFNDFKISKLVGENSEEPALIKGVKESNVSTLDIFINNSFGQLEVTNVNEINNVVQGIKFGLYEDIDLTTEIAQSVSDAYGKVVFNGLEIGKIYYLKQLSTAEGYILYDSVIPIQMNGLTEQQEITNQRMTRQIKFSRIDSETKECLSESKVGFEEISGEYYESITSTNEIQFINVPLGQYRIYEIDAPKGYRLSDQVVELNITEEGSPIEVIIESKKSNYNFVFQNIDVDTGKLIKNAKISLKGIDEENKNINYQFSSYEEPTKFELPNGKYELKQLEVPQGYIKSDEVKTFTVVNNDSCENFSFSNKRIEGQLNLSLIDSLTQKIIPGVKLNIKGTEEFNNDININITTDGNMLKVPLVYGTYEVRQIEGPDGYIINSEIEKFTINNEEQIADVKIYNNLIEKDLVIKNIDSETKEFLTGAIFQIIGKDDSNKTYKKEITIKSENELVNLPIGKYEIKEISAPNGYIVSEKSIIVDILNDSIESSLEVLFENSKIIGAIEIERNDLITGQLISGATFVINGIDKNNENIKIEFISTNFPEKIYLSKGNYMLSEKIAPVGYVKMEEIIQFEIKDNGEIIKKMISSDKIKGTLRLSEIDLNSQKYVDGSKISIIGLDENNKDFKYEFINNNSEDISLYYGKYQVREIVSAEGYCTLNNTYDFEIKNNNEIISISLLNKKIQGKLNFKNIDEETNEVLFGGKFIIIGNDENNKDFKCDFNVQNETTSIKLDYGNYILKQIDPSSGYIKSNEEISIFINSKDSVINNEFVNKKGEAVISFHQIDSLTDKVLKGGKFIIKGNGTYNKNFKYEFISKEDGNIIKIPTGNYILQQIETINGYLISDQILNIELKEIDKKIDVNFKSNPITTIVKFKKIDSKTGKIIKGCKMLIEGLDESNKKFNMQFITEDKEMNLELPLGNYKITELATIEGYVLNKEPITFKVNDKSENVNLFLESNSVTGDFKISVLSSYKDVPLENVKIGIYNENKELISTYLTNIKGVINVKLQYGKYYYKQISVPDNHILDQKYYEFNILENDKTVSLTLKTQLKENATPPSIPQTGGVNVNIIFNICITLVIAGTLLMYNKRKK